MFDWAQFFNMGGYAFYVWTSYTLAFVILLINLISPMVCQRNLFKVLARKARRTSNDPQT